MTDSAVDKESKSKDIEHKSDEHGPRLGGPLAPAAAPGDAAAGAAIHCYIGDSDTEAAAESDAEEQACEFPEGNFPLRWRRVLPLSRCAASAQL